MFKRVSHHVLTMAVLFTNSFVYGFNGVVKQELNVGRLKVAQKGNNFWSLSTYLKNC